MNKINFSLAQGTQKTPPTTHTQLRQSYRGLIADSQKKHNRMNKDMGLFDFNPVGHVLSELTQAQSCFLCKNRLYVLSYIGWICGLPIITGYLSYLLFGIVSAIQNKEYEFTSYWSSALGWGVFILVLSIVFVFKIIIPVNNSCKTFLKNNKSCK
jgi:hypothetical protein